MDGNNVGQRFDMVISLSASTSVVLGGRREGVDYLHALA